MATETQAKTGAEAGPTAGRYAVGMIGLGVMGRNLVLNIADHGFAVAGYDRDAGKVDELGREAAERPVLGVRSAGELIAALDRPRTAIVLVPAGKPVDSVIRELVPLLEPGDLVIDGGNSYFGDTDVRGKALAAKGLLYLGVGISGGEAGARKGPSMMAGGPREGYERVRALFESVAAHVDGAPCVAWLGPGAAGHYVKLVHNGIAYAIMQLIAETYDVMKRGLGMGDGELASTYSGWAAGEASGYLLEITAKIFAEMDPETGRKLVDVILDAAKQLGTGEWASQDALEIGIPTPGIDVAVAERGLSSLLAEREAASKVLEGRAGRFEGDRAALLDDLREAFYAAMILCYTQGMAQLAAASARYGYGLDLETVASIWRGGCIIRAALLEDVRAAFDERPDLPNLLMSPRIGERVVERQQAMRRVACTGAEIGLPVPGFATALSYFDSLRSAWLPANLIQAQRDYFGAHTYERIDAKGAFHTEWPEVD